MAATRCLCARYAFICSKPFATVAAFDAGNLVLVAQSLHAKYPATPFIIAGDDDRRLEITLGVNPGRAKAEEAASLVGGTLILPIFAPGENAYPDQLDPVSPASYSAHQKTGGVLAETQLAALEHMRHFTDFNDLAANSSLGTRGVERQVLPVHALEEQARASQKRTFLAVGDETEQASVALLGAVPVKRSRASRPA